MTLVLAFMLFEFHYPTGRTVRMYPGNAKEAGV